MGEGGKKNSNARGLPDGGGGNVEASIWQVHKLNDLKIRGTKSNTHARMTQGKYMYGKIKICILIKKD